jgi:hypothetical protein
VLQYWGTGTYLSREGAIIVGTIPCRGPPGGVPHMINNGEENQTGWERNLTRDECGQKQTDAAQLLVKKSWGQVILLGQQG